MDASKLSPKQAALRKLLLAAVHAEKNKQGIDDDTWKAMIRGRYGHPRRKIESSGKLSIDELIDLRNKLTGRPSPERRQSSAPRTGARGGRGKNAFGLITPAQAIKIGMMVGLVDWEFQDGFPRWSEKRFGFSEANTFDQAHKQIEGLKALYERQCAAKYGPDWREQEHENIGVARYIQLHPEPATPRKGKDI